jgi:glutamine amidotransferase
MTQTIAIIDYGSGNLRSAAKAFAHVLGREGMDGAVVITDKAEEVAKADRLVLPGQGAFGDCISGLKKVPGMIEALEEAVVKKAKPFFGICVGMQLLATRGHEFGTHEGLGWIPGDVRKMTPGDPALKIPHMGWNEMLYNEACPHGMVQSVIKNPENTLPHFYFVHSFVFDCKNSEHVAGWCDYGGNFTAMVAKDNMIGTQFHVEKSQEDGLNLIKQFLQWKP